MQSLTFFALMTSISSLAETGVESDANWNIESNLQFHSLASSGSTLFGPSLFYSLGDAHQVGIKTLLSVGSSGAYQATLAYRGILTTGKSRVFGEMGFSYNIVNFSSSVNSAGLALGFLHRLTDSLSIGGNAGFEFFGNEGPVGGYMNLGDSIRVTPKASLIVSIEY